MGAVAADFQPSDHNVKTAVVLDLSLKAVEQIALEFGDFAAAQTGHVDVIALRSAFVIVFLTFQVHEVEFVNQAMALQQVQRPVDGDPVNLRIKFSRFAENLAGIQVLFCSFHHFEDGATLMRHAQATGHQFGLKASRCLRFWQGQV